ncbi:Aste57867_22121 [Aphanomyces stellatus]|uniref:Aste57867_22121 protein n=1 Tax=Aphanomyces stellatus TaxID=120398 RepID=A0A485LPB1_9STRA|nr:hypothetical protein As57867_022052 [Aphanomyces stellatus]VFT98789.1 Aste57867_22121 [Aphanomyces stellatus]
MSLYAPVVRPDAIPPRDYPPAWRLDATLQGLGLLLIPAVLLHAVGSPFLDPVVTAVVVIPFLFLLGYVYVSSFILRRRPRLSSRYEDTAVSMECIKLLLSSVVLACLGPIWLVLPTDTTTITLQPSFLLHAPTAALYYMLPFFVGLHFIFLDTNPLFQSFGCKFPIPNRWSTFVRPASYALFSHRPLF